MHVEGTDDKHSIVHLLIRHDLDYDSKPWAPAFPIIAEQGSIDTLLEGVETAVQVSGRRAVGFVLDADSPLVERWDAIRDRLRRVNVDAPDHPLPVGFVGMSSRYQSRVGVWLMPDNQHDGALEHFLRTLIDDRDILIGHAQSATKTAGDLGARFRDTDTLKAVIHAWLAWQEEPGRPYGTAIRARFFRHDSAAANAFVAWFRRLYEIPSASG
ncbi:MAG: DUF3226 domain-containing protein [Planctomycetota bacterium]